MGGPSPGSRWVTTQMTVDEKEILEEAAREAGMNRNAFVRKIVNELTKRKEDRRWP